MIIAETPRLRLRHFTCHDVQDMAQVMGDPEVMKYSLKGHLSSAQTHDFLEDVIATYTRKGFGLWALEEKTTGHVIGYCGHYFLSIDGREEVELSYRLARSHWGKGLATEAAMATVHYAFEVLQLPRLISLIDAENRGSIRVAEHCGLTYRKETEFQGVSVKLYAIEAHKYQQLADGYIL
jgi:ribosomal-protein-alanine N-acetyltransferase